MIAPAPAQAADRRQLSLARWGATLLMAGGAILGLQAESAYRRQVLRQTEVQAEILAGSVTAALAFGDTPTVREYVNALRANPQLGDAAVYDAGGREIVRFARSTEPGGPPPPDGAAFRSGVADVVAPVLQEDARLGTVRLRTRPEPWTSVLTRHSALALLTAMGFLLLWFSNRATRVLERRAEALADTNTRLVDEMAERARVEEALRQSQKMEALGQLTGGVAHDFNNLLTVIMGGLETIGRQLSKLPADADIARLLRARDMALHGAERAATLTQRLLAFSRRQPLQPRAVDVSRLVRGMGDLLRRTLDETVHLEIVIGAGAWRTRVDPTELENAILNLAVNARDAMPDGGQLTIETANASLDEAYVANLPEAVAAGQYVMIAITDTGQGMAPDVLRQVFEPFFTTKEVGKGTGLGLSQVYGFVRQSGGHVSIYSELDQGTTVKIYLPRFLGEEEPDLRGRATLPENLIGDEKILVVEDHPELKTYSAGILRELGYDVREASNAAEAVKVLDAEPDIDLLFTDIVLPGGMNGRQLAEAATAARPGLKVLYTTGYTRNAIVHNGALDPGVELITKPFTFEDLAAKVRRVLDAEAATTA